MALALYPCAPTCLQYFGRVQRQVILWWNLTSSQHSSIAGWEIPTGHTWLDTAGVVTVLVDNEMRRGVDGSALPTSSTSFRPTKSRACCWWFVNHTRSV